MIQLYKEAMKDRIYKIDTMRGREVAGQGKLGHNRVNRVADPDGCVEVCYGRVPQLMAMAPPRKVTNPQSTKPAASIKFLTPLCPG